MPVEHSPLAVGVVVAAGLGDLVHGIEKGGNEQRPLPLIDLPFFVQVLDIFPYVADPGAVLSGKIGVREVLRHVVLLVHPEAVVVQNQVHQLLLRVGLAVKPGLVTDIVAVHDIVGDQLLVGEGGGHGPGARENVGHCADPGTVLLYHPADEIQQLVLVPQIAPVVDADSPVGLLLLLFGRDLARRKPPPDRLQNLPVPHRPAVLIHLHGEGVIVLQIIQIGSGNVQFPGDLSCRHLHLFHSPHATKFPSILDIIP